jgi:hypothetical protein
MPARIPFPATPDDGEFFTDEQDMRWQWSEFKHRWSFKPLNALSSAYTESETAPTDTELPWFRPSDGTLSIWSESDAAWIVVSGSGNDGEDLTGTVGIETVSTATHELVTANVDAYTRLTYAGGDARVVTVPEIGVGFAAVVGSLVTLRNTSATTSVTIEPGLTTTLNYETGAEVIGPQATAQLICVSYDENTGATEFDIL